MKKILTLVFTLSVLISCNSSNTIKVKNESTSQSFCDKKQEHNLYQSGSGTEESPFMICTSSQLRKIAENSSEWSKHFKLAANIDLKKQEFKPIGSYNWDTDDSVAFTGYFDGAGYSISNLKVTGLDTDLSSAFFGYIENATIKNIKIKNAEISSTKFGAILAGKAKNSNIANIELQGSVSCKVGSSEKCALLAGEYLAEDEQLKLSNLSVAGSVRGHDLVAGTIGYLETSNGSSLQIDTLESDISVESQDGGANTFGGAFGLLKATSESQVSIKKFKLEADINLLNQGSFSAVFIGTILLDGTTTQADINQVEVKGSINTPASFNAGYVGGMFGFLSAKDSSSLNISETSFIGTVNIVEGATNRGRIAGFAGLVTDPGNFHLSNNYVQANVNFAASVTGAYSIGLFIGENRASTLTIEKNYVVGQISATSAGSNIASFIGANNGSITYISNYWDNEEYTFNTLDIGNQASPAEITAADTSSMKQASTYSGWNFNSIWSINETQGYPTHQWSE